MSLLTEPKIVFAQDIIRMSEKHIVRLTFVSSTEGEPVLDEEHTDFRWLTLDEMRQIKKLDEFTREVLEKKFCEICST
ncbi:MAG: hypothetical protein A2W52_00120 [Candidatus Taylorbacteria bacterium RIFCSPHIGHO2_02_49_25]|uniref:Nudix hydrolase domain-containing protein n=1 Tax=Candidatus Taylorbacteria bacterium RIFCSPHIGHO2_02_49_25 TaxID=1802305 RepID=A0A1G2MGS6_9BACT|nr:MAG: hypothetical protein UY62_C0003G0002 [Parcubacteria group bacterium GW2011_GWF2_50_9]OHA19728.1 MAG: hypothetical protein A2759_04060 [Candidatus Taylorbacteria bacterium RIFCSPHIGHO2_01_FULL_49_60]OHA23125.1 MAG: hypothetical protein A2W52_00120 [Candidatus Taylorbacteria bacterium RIFCSPHIGHO2_02_49_25]OHA35515.1 MAG: hypothetical protein A3B27_00365 [Candidatus Taylorbacteria bacterium RIFCSPLOWO2_01_FULL_50_130]OHA35597.1 MAG: hypothetical protein A2W65_00890 [Candidatus Taylorbacte